MWPKWLLYEKILIVGAKKNKTNTIHTARTMMFLELSRVMDFSAENDTYLEAMGNNVFGKRSQDNVRKSSHLLTQLYQFDVTRTKFKAFKTFWLDCDEPERAHIALLFAVNNDYLLAESVQVIAHCKVGEKVKVETLMENVEKYHPNRFTESTLRSVAQNIASSWKQAGFIKGKVKNIRSQPAIGYKVVAFAMFLSFLDGERGDFIMHSKSVSALCLGESKLRELAIEASKRDYLNYQYAGSVTAISFDNILKKLGADAI